MSEDRVGNAQPPAVQGTAAEQLYELTVECRRYTGRRNLNGSLQTIPDLWIVGEIPAVSAMHAVTQYWKACPHKKPLLLGENGAPLRTGTLRQRDLRARLKGVR